MNREITGRHVLIGFILAFATILAANLTLAYNAIRTFPGLEVKNSYVASQSFDVDRAAQLALGWDVSAWLAGNQLWLQISQDGANMSPAIESAIFGRATSVVADQQPAFVFDGTAYVAQVIGGTGNWNLRLKLRANDGTLFQQRIIVRADP